MKNLSACRFVSPVDSVIRLSCTEYRRSFQLFSLVGHPSSSAILSYGASILVGRPFSSAILAICTYLVIRNLITVPLIKLKEDWLSLSCLPALPRGTAKLFRRTATLLVALEPIVTKITSRFDASNIHIGFTFLRKLSTPVVQGGPSHECVRMMQGIESWLFCRVQVLRIGVLTKQCRMPSGDNTACVRINLQLSVIRPSSCVS